MDHNMNSVTDSMEVNIRQAKKQFFHLVGLVEKGAEITITRARVPVARLLPIESKSIRPLGTERGKVWIADDFDAPLPDDVLRDFYGGELPELEKSPKIKRRKKEKAR
jgi:prevent-host-death family protein